MSSTIEQSLTNLNSLPPSPRLGAVGSGSLSESFSLSGLSSPVSSIEQSLTNLNSLPPSPRLAPVSSSFDSLQSFDSSKSLESLSYLAASLPLPTENFSETMIDRPVIRKVGESKWKPMVLKSGVWVPPNSSSSSELEPLPDRISMEGFHETIIDRTMVRRLDKSIYRHRHQAKLIAVYLLLTLL